ncbi:MAG: hypothetical protein ACRDOM_00055 [Nocardioides sp.]
MTDHDDTHGPGIRWLAERAGVTPEELLSDPRRLLTQLALAIRETAEQAAATASPDPQVRREARERAEELSSRLALSPTPAQRFGRAVARALRDEAERLRRES